MAVFEQPDLRRPSPSASPTRSLAGRLERDHPTARARRTRHGHLDLPRNGADLPHITALVAGPYAVVRDSVQTRAGTIDLGVFCRTSMLPTWTPTMCWR